MPRSASLLLADVLHAISKTLLWLDEKSADDVRKDLMLRSAIERELIVIGEAVIRLRKHHPSIFERIGEAHRIAGMRNVLVHEYEKVESEQLWHVAHEKLGSLAEEVRTLLDEEQAS